MDSMADINSPWVDPEVLSMPDNHPGLSDKDYVRRRRMFFYSAREHRLRRLPSPHFVYLDEETDLWQSVFMRLDDLHARHAARVYLDGRDALRIERRRIPNLGELDKTLQASTGVRLVPAEGLLHGKTYFELWADRVMPCTQFLRHASQPEYTPEPDAIHDIIGHVPPLMDDAYVQLIEVVGQMARQVDAERLEQLVRFYWFTIEFGLIEERGETRVLGAGILSSIGELEHAISNDVEIRTFELDNVLATSFDNTHLQSVLYKAGSLDEIIAAAEELRKRWKLA